MTSRCTQDFTPDFETYGKAAGSIGLQHLLFLDRCYHQKESGPDFRGDAKEDKFDMDEVDHVRLCGFDYYAMQARHGGLATSMRRGRRARPPGLLWRLGASIG